MQTSFSLPDADTLFINNVDDLLESLQTVPVIAGLRPT
jgi:hypothetical protein